MDKETENMFADVYKKLNSHSKRISDIENELEEVKFEILKLGYSTDEIKGYSIKVKRGDYSYNNEIERNGLIIAMYFMKNMKQEEIARKMGLSQGQVSKIVNQP
ncbi:sigma factor-like helix-turn-helix DNA-binding protein [uncultured Clostridium sp.]|uniref:sigma factor-like helix-turn-helix DNA-binding protein n=1 Tax=uncultured Clostridium sp. TaxID=59620 RepID=UPI00272C25F9|nr:sigma factor-like helix-turn-helix DNA-binding protein [uncultured Clostridium sp.]